MRYKFLSIFLLVFLFNPQNLKATSFLKIQRQYERFRTSEKDRLPVLKELFQSKGLSLENTEVYLRAFKHDSALELWARNKGTQIFRFIRSYQICATSGALGPKRRQGDGQVPEGLYVIDGFNPNSIFYLSLRINYPNASDKVLGKKGKLGGDIFIHGNCVTIGCIPIRDDYIKEAYVICAYARNSGQDKIEAHIFPTKFDSLGMKYLERHYSNSSLHKFWDDLKPVYRSFEDHKKLPNYTIDETGRYRIVREKDK
jgi:murein L,D-transpeptidase YafK